MALRNSSWPNATIAAWRTFGLSNGFKSVLKRNSYWLPSGLLSNSLTFLSSGEQRQEVVRRRLDDVDLAVLQRIDLGLRVGDPDPFDPIDLGELAAGQAGGRFAARRAHAVAGEHDLLARLPFVGLEDERAEPITSSTLIWAVGGVSAVFFGIMNGALDEALPSDASTRP